MRIVVTGANRGIGLEFVRQLAARGEEVHATARKPQEASALRQVEGDVTVHALDVGSAESVAAFREALQGAPVDVLINNAGVLLREGGLGAIDFEMMTTCFQVNTLGSLRVSQALLEQVKASETKKIVHISTQMGSIADNSSGGAYAYRASKAALNMVSRSMARDLSEEGVVVFAIHPGWVQTDMGGSSAKLTAEHSVASMLRKIDASDMGMTGTFQNWDDQELPW
ncbi:MAG: SDR family oxidoreductase [Myxococcota bacterium]